MERRKERGRFLLFNPLWSSLYVFFIVFCFCILFYKIKCFYHFLFFMNVLRSTVKSLVCFPISALFKPPPCRIKLVKVFLQVHEYFSLFSLRHFSVEFCPASSSLLSFYVKMRKVYLYHGVESMKNSDVWDPWTK
jgi:hypothetical protein